MVQRHRHELHANQGEWVAYEGFNTDNRSFKEIEQNWKDRCPWFYSRNSVIWAVARGVIYGHLLMAAVVFLVWLFILMVTHNR